MCAHFIDSVLVNVGAALLSGCSIAAFLVAWNHRLADRAFFEQNPFQVKRAALNSADTIVFAVFTLIGMLLDTAGEVFGDLLGSRCHPHSTYLISTVLMLFAIVTNLGFTVVLGRFIVRRHSIPTWATMMYEHYRMVVDVLRGDGMFASTREQLQQGHSTDEIARVKARDGAKAMEQLANLEDLFDLSSNGDPTARLHRLERFVFTPAVRATAEAALLTTTDED